MEVITIETSAYQSIIEKIENLERQFNELEEKARNPFKDKWLDIEGVCVLLNVSKRTLQFWRDKKWLAHTIIGKKVYYRASDIEKFLMNHRIEAIKKKGGE